MCDPINTAPGTGWHGDGAPARVLGRAIRG